MKKVEYIVSGCAFDCAPVLTHMAILSCPDGSAISIPECEPYKGPWGRVSHVELREDDTALLPSGIHIIFLSLLERNFYIVNEDLPQSPLYELWEDVDVSNEKVFDSIVVGMHPGGGVAVWALGNKRSAVVYYTRGHEISVGISQFMPGRHGYTLDGICDYYIGNVPAAKKIMSTKGVPPFEFFAGHMKQFTYEYVVHFANWNDESRLWEDYDENDMKPELGFIEESLLDGTFDKIHDQRLLGFHKAGVPEKMLISYHVGKSEYNAFFWLSGNQCLQAFKEIANDNRSVKLCLSVFIDYESNVFHFFLKNEQSCLGKLLPETMFQIIVFKNDFEYYRSNNYNQPRGAWVW